MRRQRRSRIVVSTLVPVVILGSVAGLAEQARGEQESDEVMATITGDAVAAGKAISEDLFGVFYEDINHAADGGLYPELVQNRSFEFAPIDNNSYNGLTAWERVNRGDAAGDIAVATADPLNDKNLNYLRLNITSAGSTEDAGVAIRNAGFNTGIHVEAGKRYDVSFWARLDSGQDVPVRVAVENVDGTEEHGAIETTVSADDWQKYEGELTATSTTTTGRLAVTVGGAAPAGTNVDFDMVSLFPQGTFMGRENGMRKDLAEKIADLEPSFLRFPGGCLVNAGSFEPFPVRNRLYDWKDTIGPLEERPTNRNFWGYNHTYGIGYLEYFQFAEDLGAEPLPVVNVGVNGCGLQDVNRLTAPEELAPWIQDTLDLIEFANGDVNTEWGGKRAELGHPEPFGLESIALGNEEIDIQFLSNYPLFHEAIREAYPDIKIISNSGQTASGAVFDRNWEMSRELGADLVDEHYYVDQNFLLTNNDRYDDYNRNGPHVFVGEFAARAAPANYNNYFSALSEAAYITGLERNGDVVDMAAYAPLLANTDFVNWSPDLIWFDNHQAYGTPSYYVHQMYSTHRGDAVVPTTLEAEAPEPVIGRVPGQFGTGVRLGELGGNQYVDMPEGIVQDVSDVTVSAWVNWNGSQDWSRVFDFGSGTGVYMFLTPNAGGAPGMRFAISNDGISGEQQITAPGPLPTGWHHVAVTLSGDAGTLWLDGQQVATNPALTLDPADLGETTQNSIGRSQFAADPLLDGTVDEFQIYDRALSQTEIQSLMTSAGGDAGGGNVARYSFDEPGGPTAVDSSGSGNDGTIVTSGTVAEPLYQVVTRDEDDVVAKVVNAQQSAMRTTVDLGDLPLSDTGTVTTMTAGLTDMNSFEDPTNVAPATSQVSGLGNQFVYDFPANSITFIRLQDQRAETSVGARVSPKSVQEDGFAKVVANLTGGSAGGRPTGMVTVSSGDGAELARMTVRSSNVTVDVSAAQLGPGDHQLTVSYSGNTQLKPASATVNLNVRGGP